MNGLHFFIALTEIDREMHQSVRSSGPQGAFDPDEHEQQMSRLRRLFHREPAPIATFTRERETPESGRAA